MSITGHLAQVTPEFAAEIRKDPSRTSAIVMSNALAGMANLPLTEGLDGALREMGAFGCLWGLIPRFLRRFLIARLLPPAASAPPRPLTPEERAEILDAQRALARAVREAESRGFASADASRSDPGEEEDDPASGEDEEPDEPDDDPASDEDSLGLGASPADGDLLAHLDLHKHWQILHFALTGQADGGERPAADAILGGEEVGEDVGYGPLRILSPETVAAVASHLEQVGVEGIVQGVRSRRVPDDVYGADFAREWEELRLRARALCTFYAEAAREGRAVLAWLA